MKGSLRARMALGFTLAFALFAALSCAAFAFWAERAARRDAEERVDAAASHLAQEWRGSTPAEAFEEVHEDARLDEVAMLLIDGRGNIAGSDGHPALAWPVPRVGWISRTVAADRGLSVAGIAWAPIKARLREELLALAAFALLATLAAGGAAWFLVGRTLRPIGRLADGADAASSDPLHARLIPPSEDAEMTHLVATLNGLLERIAVGIRSREQFYAAAAHELRTPLAVLSAEAEIALSRPREAQEHEETLRDLQAQIRRLTSLVESLLTLNRLEAGGSGETAEAADPADLADSALATLETTIRARGLVVEARLEGTAQVEAPPGHLYAVVRNLIENAVRHAPEGGRVEVVVEGSLRVRNDLAPRAPSDFEPLFEPFARGDSSHAVPGNGLGLAICRRVAQANGWNVTLRREAGRAVAEVAFAPPLDGLQGPSQVRLRSVAP